MAVLVGRKAPHFSETAVVNGKDIVDGFSLDQYLDDKYVILFFYPETSPSSAQPKSMPSRSGEFDARNCAIVGVSTDTAETHRRTSIWPRRKGG